MYYLTIGIFMPEYQTCRGWLECMQLCVQLFNDGVCRIIVENEFGEVWEFLDKGELCVNI